MRIYMDTGDLRNLAVVARHCATATRDAAAEVRRASQSTQLNTRDDENLRRRHPIDELHAIDRDLRHLESDYQARARRYDQRAAQIESIEARPWRPLPFPIPIGVPGSWWRPVSRWSFGGQTHAPYLTPSVGNVHIGARGSSSRHHVAAPRKANFLERGVGLISGGINRLLRGFHDVSKKIVETTSGAWDRVWGKTKSVLKSAVDGIKNIAVYSGRVAIHGIKTVIGTAGRWIVGGVHAAWNFMTRTYDFMNRLVAAVLDIKEIAVAAAALMVLLKDGTLFKFLAKTYQFTRLSAKALIGIGLVVGAIDTIVSFARYGIGDARFWSSLVMTLGGTIAAAVPFGGAAWLVGTFIGAQISKHFVMPIIDRYYDEISARNSAAIEEKVRAAREAVARQGPDITPGTTVTKPYISGPQPISNSSIADSAEAEIRANPKKYQGQTGWNQQGECMVAMARWVGEADGSWPGSAGGPLSGFQAAGAKRLTVPDLSRGDVIQRWLPKDPSSWDHVHTMVVLEVDPTDPNLVTIAESNYDFNGSMRTRTVDLRDVPHGDKGWEWSYWRLGSKP